MLQKAKKLSQDFLENFETPKSDLSTVSSYQMFALFAHFGLI